MGWASRRRRRGSTILCLFLALGVFALPAAAGPEERLEEIQDKQDEAQHKLEEIQGEQEQLETDLGGLDDARDSIEAKIDLLDADLAALDSRIDEVKEDLVAAQLQLTELSDELRKIGNRLHRRTNLLEANAVAAYKAGPTAAMDGLLTATSFADLVDRVEYYQSALDAEATLIQEIEALEAETEEKRAEVEEKREAITDQKLALEEDRAEVAVVINERAGALAEKEDIISAKKTLLADAQDREVELEEWLDQLEADSQEIEAILAAPENPTAPSTGAPPSGSGQLLWPTSGPLTSPFGYRVHPIFGDMRQHAGIDIGAPYGAPVYAADTGRVSYAGAMSGYGNVLVIDHGGGLATTYNHLSAFATSVGASVGRGVQIGSVGCTGYCTGPHLHFEVRVNGTPVAPMPYLQ
ncbi:MAG TPA: peptidoglycan DD-metalloendopeptidase family protein [Actinomycetota bacterium]|nr:peptidoglycan DD-metalloendopeptidase family protein [Actinomycetota bacterium]